ncbi:MAG: hypothetical protein DA330_09935 [Nitrososphaera sp.]|nr:hypothetical protein [Nitrososphaera sp.]
MSTEEKVSQNAKHLFLVGLGILGTLVAYYLHIVATPTAIENINAAKEVLLLMIGSTIGFLGGMADKLWGK